MTYNVLSARYFVGGTVHEITFTEMLDFQSKLFEAQARLMYSTGKRPTHFILGLAELIAWIGMVALMEARGEVISDGKGIHKRQFAGMTVVFVSQDTLCLAGTDLLQ